MKYIGKKHNIIHFASLGSFKFKRWTNIYLEVQKEHPDWENEDVVKETTKIFRDE